MNDSCGEPLTAQQLRVMRFIVAYRAAHDQPPTSREIAQEFGVSCQTIDGHISELIGKGQLAPRRARHRHIVLTAAGREAVSEIGRRRKESSTTSAVFRPIAGFRVDSVRRLRT